MESTSSPPDNSHAHLLARIREGDEVAFAAFYQHMAPALYGLVHQILGDAKEAEDVLQDGFLHVWRKAATYDPARSSPTTWAFMIFRNKAIDTLRARARRGRGIEKVTQQQEVEPALDVTSAQAVFRAEEGQVVQNALQEISTEQREAIRLAFFKGLTHLEIAERLGAPVGTIKARIRRGLVQLGERLGGLL